MYLVPHGRNYGDNLFINITNELALQSFYKLYFISFIQFTVMVTLTKYSHLLLSTVVGNDVSDVLIGWVHLKKPLTSLAFTTDDTSHWIQ